MRRLLTLLAISATVGSVGAVVVWSSPAAAKNACLMAKALQQGFAKPAGTSVTFPAQWYAECGVQQPELVPNCPRQLPLPGGPHAAAEALRAARNTLVARHALASRKVNAQIIARSLTTHRADTADNFAGSAAYRCGAIVGDRTWVVLQTITYLGQDRVGGGQWAVSRFRNGWHVWAVLR